LDVQKNPQKVLFARIGWMKYYRGLTSDDSRLVGGGSYNKTNVGSELYNFKQTGKNFYGYVQPAGSSENRSTLRLDRIDPSIEPFKDRVAGVTVVFVATNPEAAAEDERQRIIGWYRDATVYRTPKENPTEEDHSYNLAQVRQASSDAVLVPTPIREHEIPRGKGGMGQANVRYGHGVDGRPDFKPWMRKALDYIKSYRRENLIDGPEPEVADLTEIEIERAAGRQSDPRIRRAIETYAMERVKAYYQRRGYYVEDRHAIESFDLLCSKNKDRLYVEVKGTQGDGSRILLTHREVALSHQAGVRVDLCVVHSIALKQGRQLKPMGGNLRRFEHWDARKHVLRPCSFICDLNVSLLQGIILESFVGLELRILFQPESHAIRTLGDRG
jgi:hypothetical protein